MKSFVRNGFRVLVSDDGLRAIGRSIPNRGATAPKVVGEIRATEPEIIPITRKPVTNELMAQIATWAAEDYTEKAEAFFKKADRLQEEKKFYQKKFNRTLKFRKFFRKSVLGHLVITALIGFILGLLLAVSQMLTEHGPTVTLWGTIGACGIYLITGIFFAAFFGWLGREQAVSLVEYYSERAKEFRDIIDEIDTEIEEAIKKGQEYVSLAADEKHKSWQYRGLR